MSPKALFRHFIIYGNLAALYRYFRELKRLNDSVEKDKNEFDKELSYTLYRRARWTILFGRPISKAQEDKLEQIYNKQISIGLNKSAAKRVGRRLMLGRYIDFESGQITPRIKANLFLAAITLFLTTLCTVFLFGMTTDLIAQEASTAFVLTTFLMHSFILGCPVVFFLYMAFAPIIALAQIKSLNTSN
jgi:hypothetical protein